jgi:hypothetical protein
VQPLSAFLGTPAPRPAPPIAFITPFSAGEQRTSLKFFEEWNWVLQFCPTHPSETELMAQFARLGIGRGQSFLDTGMRRGEMLSLRFGDIDRSRQLILLLGETTKSGKGRMIPIGTARLLGVLEWLQLDASEERKTPETLVFTNEVGEPVGSFRTAWVTTVLKAHGSSLSGARADGQPSRRLVSPHFAESILHWHDLRHEYASRLVERGVPLSQVRDLLGHASIVTTERYDNQKLEKLQAAAAKLETGKQFEVPAPVTIGTNLQVSFKKSSSRVRQQRTVMGTTGSVNPLTEK